MCIMIYAAIEAEEILYWLNMLNGVRDVGDVVHGIHNPCYFGICWSRFQWLSTMQVVDNHDFVKSQEAVKQTPEVLPEAVP